MSAVVSDPLAAGAGEEEIYLPPVSIAERVHADTHVLLWQARGSSDLLVDDEHTSLVAGYGVWVPAGVRHEIELHSHSVMLPMFFAADATKNPLSDVTVFSVDSQLRTLFLALTQAQNTIIRPAADLHSQITMRLAGLGAPVPALPMPVSEPMRVVARALLENPADDRTIEQLARSVHTSTRTLERTFLAETGSTIRSWRLRSRMESAATQLKNTREIAGVAHSVGYGNVSAFRRAFKAHFGMTPGAYAMRYGVRRG